MNRINRSQAGILAVVVLLLIIISSSLLGSFGGYGGMMGLA